MFEGLENFSRKRVPSDEDGQSGDGHEEAGDGDELAYQRGHGLSLMFFGRGVK